MEAGTLNRPGVVRQTFIALRHRNYRLWFIGQLISLIGTWMQSTAQGYLVYQLTGSAAFLGVIGFAGGLPTWLFTLYGGVIADRFPRRRLMLGIQAAMMTLSFLLALLVFAGVVRPWHIVILAFLLGVANAFEAPTRQSFVAELVEDRADLTNAIALNSMLFNTATMIGPAVAGFTYAALGPGACFTMNGLSFAAVLLALWRIRVAPRPSASSQESALSQLRGSFGFIRARSSIWLLLTALGVFSVGSFGVLVQIPLWATAVLGGDVKTNGFLLSARGIGAVLGALLIAALGRKNLSRLWKLGLFLLPAFLVPFALVRWIPGSLLLMTGVGMALMFVFNTTNAMVQAQIPDEQRGRVMAFYVLIFLGGMPLGSLLVGTLAELLSAPTAILISAAVLIGFALLTLQARPQLRGHG